jgi:hypothetical protein
VCAALALTAAGFAARGAASRGAGAQPAAAQEAGGGAGGARDPDLVPKKLAYATELPDSLGRGIAQRWCLQCHSAMLITQQAKDSAAWEKTLGQMEKWGVAVTPEERDTLRVYLLQNFGPRSSGPR